MSARPTVRDQHAAAAAGAEQRVGTAGDDRGLDEALGPDEDDRCARSGIAVGADKRREVVVADSQSPGRDHPRPDRCRQVRDAIGPENVATMAIVCRTPTRQTLREPAGPAVETIGLDDLPALLR